MLLTRLGGGFPASLFFKAHVEMNAPLLKHLIKPRMMRRILVKVVARHHKEYCFKVLSVSWSGVGCGYVTGTQLPTSWEKVSLLAKHAQTALLLSLSIPPRSASPAIWKKVSSAPLISPVYLTLFSLYNSITSPFHLHHFLSHLQPDYYNLSHSISLSTIIFFTLFSGLLSHSDSHFLKRL